MVRRLDLPTRALSLAQPVELHPGRVPRPPGTGRPASGRSAAGNRRADPDRLAVGRQPPLLSPLVGARITAQSSPGRLCPHAQRRPEDPERDQAASLRAVRVPGPARHRPEMTISEPPQMRCAPQDPDNLLDRLTSEAT